MLSPASAMYAESVSISQYWNRGRSTYLQSRQHMTLARLTLTNVTDDYYKSVVNEMVVNACDVPVYEVVVKLQHTELGVLIDKEAYVEGQVVGQACLAGRHFVGVVGDDVELAEPFVIDQQRRPDFGGICHIPVSIDVGHRLPIRRVS